MSGKILLVEDEAIVALAKQQELTRCGYETSYVTTGEKAIDLVCNRNKPIDLILMDIDLGRGIDGTEAARRILEVRKIPIVFISSHEEPEIVRKTEKIDAYGYVMKSSGIAVAVLDASIKTAFKLFEKSHVVSKHQESLSRREKELQESLRGAQLGIWRFHIESGAVIWTDGLYRLFGVDPSQFSSTYNDLAVFFMSESWKLLTKAIDESLRTGESFEIELQRAKDGEPTGWMRVRGAVVRDDAKKTVELSCVMQDITREKQREDALLRDIEQFKALVNSSPFPIGIADIADEKILYWSKSARDMFGHQPETVVEWFTLAYPDPDYRQEVLHRWKDNLGRARQIETAVNTGEYRITCADGSVKLCQIFAHFTSDQLIVTFDDVTSRKQMENELRERVEQHRNLIETIQEGVWQLDLNNNTTYVNQKMADMLGYTVAEMMGAHLFSFMDDQGIAKATSLLERRKKGIKEQHDFEFITKNGARIYLLLETTPLLDQNGDYYGSLAAAMDITERKRAEGEIQRQLIEKETLLKEVNHRIKNNMAQVESLLSLQANATEDVNVRSALHDAMARVATTRTLYEKLLIGEVYDHVSMREYLEGIIDSLTEIFYNHSDVVIEKRITEFTLPPRDAIPIGIILNELLTNAFKYAFDDTSDGWILIQLEKTESRVTLTVQDDGVGFSRRMKTDQVTGFGSTIVSMLAEQFRGSFLMDGNGGTTSTVTLFV